MQMNETDFLRQEAEVDVIAALLELSRRYFESDLVTVEPWRRLDGGMRRHARRALTPRVGAAWRKRIARLRCGSPLAGLYVENDDAGAE